VTSPQITLVPTWRLGSLLRDARDHDGRSLEDLAATSDRFDAFALADVEAGERPLTDADLQHILAVYRVDPDVLVPGRTDLIVDLDHGKLATAGHTQPLAGAAPTADVVLASYLSLVYALRSMTPGTRVPLRDADLEVLAQALALATPEVAERLESLMVNPSAEVHKRSKLLRARVLVPAAGILVAVTVAGALVVSSRSDTSPKSGTNAAVPANEATVDVGSAAVRTRNPDGSPGVEVIIGENISGSDVPAGAAAIGSAQVVTRDANGNAVQSDRAPDPSLNPSASAGDAAVGSAQVATRDANGNVVQTDRAPDGPVPTSTP
jgi:hypothetical protein